MAKISMIGAGSIVFARNLMTDILSYPELRDSEISLMDIDLERLELIERLGKKIIDENGFDTELEATTDRRESLENADYVISIIQVGGLDAFELDIEIPNEYGVNQAVGDTLGPGGVFRGLRTIPVYIDMAEDMEELCPDTLFINYVNPMAINCWAMNEATEIETVGLCHSVQGTARDMAEYVGEPFEEVNYRAAGINHMAWFLNFEKEGEDLYPRLKEKYHDSETYEKDVTKFEILKHFDYFVSESSIHMSEYVPYFRDSEEWRERIHRRQGEEPSSSYGGEIGWTTDDESGVYLKVCRKKAENFLEDMEDMIDESDFEINRSLEYGSRIIHSMETGNPTVIHGNVRNDGLIDNLPEGCTVEVPCLVDKSGIQPTDIGELPPQLAALNRTNVNVQKLAVEGALNGSKEKVEQAVMMDPLTSSVLDLNKIRKMVGELFKAEDEYLPQF
ncbi:alpha-galactosidase [candidate division MSBL1 archaeon SCGC-AAA259E17]|uniref:Alpha-galactosidase n=1 Tax=candidate division MSBL1 archaeon SCGC-AAA259E17 TaxID=1698263 RepID=A0A133UD22_9EURY|nr:alpha-galactosidase [candidate division MSBL1 archaeon SCGC-AAA259E17]